MNSNQIIQDMFDAVDDSAAKWLERFRKDGKHIYLFGAGHAGADYAFVLKMHDVPIYAFCDNDRNKVGGSLAEIPVVSFEEMRDDSNKYVIISAVNAFSELEDQCERSGIHAKELCFVDWLHYRASDKKVLLSRAGDFAFVYNKCSDNESRKVYATALINRIQRDIRFFKNIKSDGEMYFDNRILQLGKEEVFFDCGAADGDTALRFNDLFGGKIYAFEPDYNQYEQLRKNTAGNDNIISINAGVGDSNVVRSFAEHAIVGGYFDNAGTNTAQLQTIDSRDLESPTFIKMDIQGYELSALHGAEETIRQFKPKMAICVYHKTSDFFDIPQYILSIRSDYRVYFRHYRDDTGDTVCYFV